MHWSSNTTRPTWFLPTLGKDEDKEVGAGGEVIMHQKRLLWTLDFNHERWLDGSKKFLLLNALSTGNRLNEHVFHDVVNRWFNYCYENDDDGTWSMKWLCPLYDWWKYAHVFIVPHLSMLKRTIICDSSVVYPLNNRYDLMNLNVVYIIYCYTFEHQGSVRILACSNMCCSGIIHIVINNIHNCMSRLNKTSVHDDAQSKRAM